MKLTDEQIDKIVLKDLKLQRKAFTKDLKKHRKGKEWVAFFSTDPREDQIEIQRHIDALDLIIKHYSPLT